MKTKETTCKKCGGFCKPSKAFLGAVSSRFVNVKLRRDVAEAMISTYEFLVWNNVGEDKKECQRILKALKKALS